MPEMYVYQGAPEQANRPLKVFRADSLNLEQMQKLIMSGMIQANEIKVLELGKVELHVDTIEEILNLMASGSLVGVKIGEITNGGDVADYMELAATKRVPGFPEDVKGNMVTISIGGNEHLCEVGLWAKPYQPEYVQLADFGAPIPSEQAPEAFYSGTYVDQAAPEQANRPLKVFRADSLNPEQMQQLIMGGMIQKRGIEVLELESIKNDPGIIEELLNLFADGILRGIKIGEIRGGSAFADMLGYQLNERIPSFPEEVKGNMVTINIGGDEYFYGVGLEPKSYQPEYVELAGFGAPLPSEQAPECYSALSTRHVKELLIKGPVDEKAFALLIKSGVLGQENVHKLTINGEGVVGKNEIHALLNLVEHGFFDGVTIPNAIVRGLHPETIIGTVSRMRHDLPDVDQKLREFQIGSFFSNSDTPATETIIYKTTEAMSIIEWVQSLGENCVYLEQDYGYGSY